MNDEKKPKYKLRKLSIGVVSFMCGFTILFGSFANVNAQVPASSTVKVIDKSNWPSMIADKSNEGKPLKPGTGFYGGDSNDEVGYTETVQPLGGWTNPRMSILPDNLGASYAQNQGKGKVIEYTLDDWNAATNHDQFGWKPIGTKVGIDKEALSGLVIATPGGEKTLYETGIYNYQNGFIPNSQREGTDSGNALVLANYADKTNYRGVYRLVNVTGEKELSWRSSYTAGTYPNQQVETFKVVFYDNENNKELGTRLVHASWLQDANGVLMIPEGTKTVRVELVPTYNNDGGWNLLSAYSMDKNIYRFNVLIDGFELYKTSKMKDALPEDEKIQVFRNGSTGTYNFTVKNASSHESGTDGGAQIAPYLSNGTNGPVLDWSKAGVNLKFENKLPSAAVYDNKTTLYDYGMKNQQSQFVSGASQKLELKTIDLRENTVDRPQLINVDAYKLNYSTQAKSFRTTFNANNYIRREYTDNDTAYHQDVVANSAEAAASYGDKLTDKIVGESATGRSIIILMDKTKLQEAVNAEKLKNLNEGDYTAEAWQKYQQKLERAKAILAENEELSYLKDDTVNKLNSMAGQSEINTLASELPTILVKAPTLAGDANGSITFTPAENTVKMTVKYKDGDKDITVEVTKTENPKETPDAQPTYSWNITGVDTVEGDNPTVHTTDAPTGVSIDNKSGMVTIQSANINQGSTITAKDINASNQESKATTFTTATFTSTPVSYLAGSGEADNITKNVTTADTVTNVRKEIVEVDGQNTSEVPQTAGNHTVKVKVTYTKDGITTSTVEEVTVKVSPATVEGSASYFTNVTDKEAIVKKAFDDANKTAGITINGNITVTKVDGQPSSDLPSTVKETGDGVYTVTGTATITKDGKNYENQEITVKVKVVEPATFKTTPVTYVAGHGDADAIKNAVTPTEGQTGVTNITKEIVGDNDQPTQAIPQTAGEHTVKVKVSYTKDGIETSTTQEVTVTVTPATTATINPPSVIAQNDGSVTITPTGNDADTIKVGFVDNDEAGTKIAITANKNEQGKWSLENQFTGVGIDSESGVITINSGVAKAGTEVTAVAEKNGIKSATATATVKDSKNPVKPPVIEQANGSVTITPQGDVNKIDISFTDKNDKEVQVVAEKNVQGNWNLKNQVDGVSINQDTGVVTLSSGTAKVGSEVKAKESKDGTESGEAKVTVIDSNKPVKPGPGPVKPQETNSSDKDERLKRHEKTEKHEVVKKEKVKDNGVRYLDGRVKITPVGIDDNNKFVYKRTLYIKGYPDNTVRPDNDLTRAEVAMILARLDGLELDDNEYPNFNDTKTDAWYNAAINAVVKKGYMKGYPDSKFYPNKKITRAELANIMVNVYSASGNELKNFSDIKSHWAEDAIKKASESGFVSGYEDGTFKPDKFITRAESVKMFNLLYLYKLSAGNILKIEESKDFKDFKDNEKKDWYYDDIVESTNDYYFTLDNKGVDISDTENEANINQMSVSTDDINVIKDGYGSIVRFLNNGSTK